MITGQAATAQGFGPLGSAYGGLLPSDLDGSMLPPAGSPNYFGAVDTNVAPSGNTFQIWKFHVDWTSSVNSSFGTASNTPNFNLTVDTYRWFMCNGSHNCIPQPGTSVGLDPIPDRLMNRLQYRRFADGHESLVANHTVGVGSSGNQAAIRWYEIRNLASTPTIYQQGTYAATRDNRWMGSMAMDQAGDIALGYSVSSNSVFPSIRYTGRLVSDPPGTLPQGEATIINGSGSQTSQSGRWGDYSMMAVDPTDDCTFWYTQEYYMTTSDRGWQTRVGSFKFPGCTPAAARTAVSTQQYTLANSDGSTWVDMDPTTLSLTITLSATSVAVLSANADLFTGSAGYNQDLGIDVNGSIAAWKESGGFAGTFSPNAAFVQTVVTLNAGTTYTVKLRWKTNRPAAGTTIYAGAGPIGSQYSPTRLTAQLTPVGAGPSTAVSTQQYTLANSDGSTWVDMDPTTLSLTITPSATSVAVLSANADLFTGSAGYNQDLGIDVNGSIAAWKESGGFAGTFSPNAAFVQTVVTLNAGTTYTVKLRWKTNRPAAGTTIYAGAGPIGSQYSPSRLTALLVPL
jgi:hypothetical protein